MFDSIIPVDSEWALMGPGSTQCVRHAHCIGLLNTGKVIFERMFTISLCILYSVFCILWPDRCARGVGAPGRPEPGDGPGEVGGRPGHLHQLPRQVGVVRCGVATWCGVE